jgi:crossover junction endodeoxyribonuclease RuvC
MRRPVGRPLCFVGIDPGLTCTSVTVFCGDVATVQAIEPVKLRGPERLDYLRRTLLDLLPPPAEADLIAVEGYAFGAQNAREAMGEWGGILRWSLWAAGYRYVVVPPSSLKAFVTGKGNAPKEVMMREVFRKWAFVAESNDDADSYALARFAVAFHAGGGSKQFGKLAAKCEVLRRVAP